MTTSPGGIPDRAAPDVSDASVGELIGSVTRDLSTLMRQELALARAELKQEAGRAGKARRDGPRPGIRLNGGALPEHHSPNTTARGPGA